MSQKWAPTCHNTKKYRDHNKNFSRGKAPQRARVVTDHQNTPINTPIRSERCPVKATTTATPPPPPTNRTIHLRLSRVGSIPGTLIAATVTRTSERTPANPNGSIGEAKVASKTTVRAKSNAILFAESTRRVVRRLLEDTQSFTHTHTDTHTQTQTHRKKERQKERTPFARSGLNTRLSNYRRGCKYGHLQRCTRTKFTRRRSRANSFSHKKISPPLPTTKSTKTSFSQFLSNLRKSRHTKTARKTLYIVVTETTRTKNDALSSSSSSRRRSQVRGTRTTSAQTNARHPQVPKVQLPSFDAGPSRRHWFARKKQRCERGSVHWFGENARVRVTDD